MATDIDQRCGSRQAVKERAIPRLTGPQRILGPSSGRDVGQLKEQGAITEQAGAELDLASVIGREMLLRDALALLPKNAYDYILLDCPPSLGLLPLNALAAADEVFIVLQTEFFSILFLGSR